MASWLSVTVSIAADINGMFSDIPRVSRVRVSASDGKTDDAAGFNRTSSNVSASGICAVKSGMMPPVMSVALIYT
jgi:hypothetical protein